MKKGGKEIREGGGKREGKFWGASSSEFAILSTIGPWQRSSFPWLSCHHSEIKCPPSGHRFELVSNNAFP